MLRRLAFSFIAVLTFGIAVLVAKPDILDCSTKFQEASEIDWYYVRNVLAGTLNKYVSKAYGGILGGYTRTLTANDIDIVFDLKTAERLEGISRPFEDVSFGFRIPDRERSMSGVVTRCGLVEVVW